MLYFIHIASGIVLITLGTTIYFRRKYSWITGYSAQGQKEKAQFDMVRLAKLVRNVFVTSGTVMVIIPPLLVHYSLINLSLLLSFSTVVAAIFYISYRSKQFKRKEAVS